MTTLLLLEVLLKSLQPIALLELQKNGAQIVILNYDPTPFDSEASIIINEYIEKICDEIT
ncbi:MAG: hypothetical protein CM15mP12_3490 [Gammaproteobacteria bacterium]|nr:MAG: hypothetical protein CM15mP12_3490 [Gammaproteobacteria bacterium]